MDIIVGIHSIGEALLNKNRVHDTLFLTDESKNELIKLTAVTNSDLENINIEMVSPHRIQEEGKKFYRQKEFDFHRIPSQMFLLTSDIETKDQAWLYQEVENHEDIKILALDQVTDVHNAGAILRTAAFYNVSVVIIPNKGTFGINPSFYRIASGATEHVKIVPVNSLSKTINKLTEKNVCTIALSEHSENPYSKSLENKKNCLIVGKEDVGISNAVMRAATHQLSLPTQGAIKSLNVSVAAAVAMEKTFS